MNGYTTITIAGKTVGLKFGMFSFRLINEKLSKLRGYTGDALNETGIAVILHAGYLNNCLVKEIDPDPELSFETFTDFTDSAALNSDGDQIRKAVEAWTQSQFFQKSVELAKEETKKKLTGTKSKREHSEK